MTDKPPRIFDDWKFTSLALGMNDVLPKIRAAAYLEMADLIEAEMRRYRSEGVRDFAQKIKKVYSVYCNEDQIEVGEFRKDFDAELAKLGGKIK